MKSSIIALVIFGLFLTFVQCKDKENISEYVIQQGLFSGGRTYDIESKTNANSTFTIENDVLHVGIKLVLIQDGTKRFIVKHEILHLWSTWTIIDAVTDQELGTIRHEYKFIGSEIDVNSVLGHYKIEGRFLNREFTIKKDDHTVAEIDKKSWHVHDTYGLTVYGNADQGLMVLLTIVMDEIIRH